MNLTEISKYKELKDKEETKQKISYTRTVFAKKYDISETYAASILKKVGAEITLNKFNKTLKIYTITPEMEKEIEEYLKSNLYKALAKNGSNGMKTKIKDSSGKIQSSKTK